MTDTELLASLIAAHLPGRSVMVNTPDGSDIVWTPPLTSAEQVIWDRIRNITRSAVPGITPAEWQAIESDIAGLVTFQGLPTPTLAQAVAAIKAQSRILRALLRS